MSRVVAQGTFDLLHPGHLDYLQQAAEMGDELHVIIARSTNITHKRGPVVPGRQRVEMVEALDPVDHALLGHPEDIFVPVVEIQPDVIVIGHDQHHDPDAIQAAAAERGVDCEVRRASKRDRSSGQEILSTTTLIDRICEDFC